MPVSQPTLIVPVNQLYSTRKKPQSKYGILIYVILIQWKHSHLYSDTDVSVQSQQEFIITNVISVSNQNKK